MYLTTQQCRMLGVRGVIERCTIGVSPPPPPTNEERLAHFRLKAAPMQQCEGNALFSRRFNAGINPEEGKKL